MIMQDGIVRAMKGISPVWLAPDVNFVAIGVDLANYATNTALATKQNTLTAGTGMVFHEKLLEGTKVKSLVAGEHITMTSTGEFVNISGDMTYVNTQLATKANQATTYTKTEVDTALTLKADQSALNTTNTTLAGKQNTLTAGTAMVFHEKLLEGTKVKSLVPGNNITMTSTDEFVNINLSSGLVLNDVSVQNLFALAPIVSTYGTIQLGSWRLRGSESNNFVLERFDNDGAIAAIAWIPVAEFSFNTDTNTSTLQLSSLGVTNSLSAGSMTSGGFPVITTSNGYTKAQVDTQFSNLIDSAPNALNTLKELANALANDANYATTVQNQLALKANQSTTYTKTEVDSSLNQKQDALLISTPSGGSSLITNSGVVKGLKTNSPITLTDASNVLTLGLNTTALSNDFALKFTPVDPLIEDYNVLTNQRTLKIDPLGTMTVNEVETNTVRANGASQVSVDADLVVYGNLTINGSLINYNPFWVSGRVAGSNLAILKSNGEYGFTVSRPAGAEFATGVYKITFNTPAPDANYVISLAQIGSGNIKVWDYNSAFDGRPAATHFHVVTYNTSWALTNWNFYFSVFV
jgi:hypothetical protein